MSARQSSSSRRSLFNWQKNSSGYRRGWWPRLFSAASAGLKSCKPYRLDPLEQRTLFNSFFGIDPTTGVALAPQQFDYYTGGEVVRINYYHVNFETIGVSIQASTGNIVNPATQANTVTDLPAATTPEPAIGAQLFKIYVSESYDDSYITIAQLLPGPPPAISPYTGAIPKLAVVNATTGVPYAATAPAGTGTVILGAYDPTTKPIANTPYVQANLPGGANVPFGIFPGTPDGTVTPGIEVAPINPRTLGPNNFGEFLFGGTITGSISFGGNVNEFYAGALFTGNTLGDFATPLTAPTGARTVPNNFFVPGDLRNFITAGPVGTDGLGTVQAPAYVTSFDLNVGGKLGEVHVGNGGRGAVAASFMGTIEAGNSPLISGQTAYPASATPNLTGILSDQTETEDFKFGFGGALDFTTGLFAAGINFSNNLPADEQILGSIPEINSLTGLPQKDPGGNIIYYASVDGELDNVTPINDAVDNYAVPFMAGTTFQVTVTNATLHVIDPDGRVIASNTRSGIGPQQFTADRPGLYTFQMIAPTTGVYDYNVTVTNTGQLGLGGIVVNQNFSDIGIDSGIISGNADLGVINVGGTYISTTFGPTPTVPNASQSGLTTPPVFASTSILVASGNLRALIGGNIGLQPAGAASLSNGPTLSIPRGSVGLVQSIGILNLETQFDPNFLLLTVPVMKTDDLYASAIGQSIQVIDAGTIFQGDVATNAGIGTLRAGNMATLVPSYLDVNADNLGFDGIIDLIDCNGDLGTLGAGGPGIVTHDGGNVRYLKLAGAAYLPASFGGVGIDPVIYPVGVAASFTDDSGAVFTVTPVGVVTTTSVADPLTGVATTTTSGPQVSAFSYPVLDKAGLIPVSVDAITVPGASASLVVSASGVKGAGSTVDVAEISIIGIGRPITAVTTNASTGVTTNNSTGTVSTLDAFGNPLIQQAVPTNGSTGTTTAVATDITNEFLSIDGPGTVNVLHVTAFTIVNGQSPVAVINNTGGEIVGLDTAAAAPASTAPGLGSIQVRGNLGFATPTATAAAVMPRSIITNGETYPFVHQHTGVVIGSGFVLGATSAGTYGDIVSISVGGAVGNIQAGGTIQSIVANSAQSNGGKNAGSIAGQFNGIVGPILGSRLLMVNVGQGLLPTGTGAVGFAGLYGTIKVGQVVNTGNVNGDIRGNIISAEDDFSTSGIDSISVGSASIIGSRIETLVDFVGHIPAFIESSDLSPFVTVINTNSYSSAPGTPNYVYDIGPITASGAGGLIGLDVATGSIAAVTVNAGGFGIFNSTFSLQTTGRLESMTASGYGIRGTTVTGAGFVGPITATGNGSLIPSTSYPIDVRPSDNPLDFDPFFGITPDNTIDINADLGTSRLTPNIPNRTDTGVIEDDIFRGLNDFTSLTAQKARTALPLLNNGVLAPIPTVANIPVIGVPFANSIAFGGVVGSVKIKQLTDGLQITAGRLNKFSLSSSVNRLGLSVAGNISSILIKGNLGQYITDPANGQIVPDSYINAGGPSGSISSLKVLGNLNANVYATGSIGSVLVSGDMLGGLSAFGQASGLALGSLRVIGGVRDGSLVLHGNVGSIIVNRTFGTATGSLDILGNANLISVGANHSLHGSQLALALTVEGTLKTLKVFGSITGTVHTALDLGSLMVTNDGTSPNSIISNITIDGRLGTAMILGGNVTSTIIANGSITNFTINRGNLNAGATVQSNLDAIRNFRILGGFAYGLYGSLIAANGGNENIDISGNVGDGINALQIIANAGNVFRVRGDITANTTIAITNQLNQLRVNGSVRTGATISAHPLQNLIVTGLNNGTITSV